jgi:hypothetical protein
VKRKKPIIKCIYCGKSKSASQEHYLPECLGNFNGFEGLNDRICGDCNGEIGKLEDQFCHAGEVGLLRWALGIKGKKHKTKVNPFLRGSAGAPPFDMKGKMLGGNQEVLFQVIEGSMTDATYIPHMIVTDESGKEYYIRIPDDMTDPAELERSVNALGIEKIKSVNILVSTTERERVDKLTSLIPVRRGAWKDLPTEGGPVSLVTNYEVDDKYFRTIAKIGFHYVLKHFHFRGDEEMFAGIRKFIVQGGDISPFVSHSKTQVIEQVKWDMVTADYTHFIIAKSEHGRLSCYLQFFLGPHSSTPDVYTVEIAKTQTALYYQSAHAFSYYANGPEKGWDGVLIELIALACD